MYPTPKEVANQIGVCEHRSVLLKMSFQAVRRVSPEAWGRNMVMAVAVAARNSTPPSGCGFPPLYLSTGNNAAERWGTTSNDYTESFGRPSAEMFHQRQQSMTVALDSIMLITARQTIENAKNRQLRTGAHDVFAPSHNFFGHHPIADGPMELDGYPMPVAILLSKQSENW